MYFRLIAPALAACVLVLMMGPYVIPLLRRLKFGQAIREDGPQWHQAKAGTPTMGGLMILAAVVLGLVIAHRHWSYDLWAGLGAILGFVMLCIAVVFGLVALVQKINGTALGGFTTVILLLLFSSSIVMISLGIIGYYIARIYEEIKGRPRYIISQVCGREDGESA